MFEFRLRILEVRERDSDPPSFLGIVEGFPEILVHAMTAEQAERDLVNALSDHLKGLQDSEPTHLQHDDFPDSADFLALPKPVSLPIPESAPCL